MARDKVSPVNAVLRLFVFCVYCGWTRRPAPGDYIPPLEVPPVPLADPVVPLVPVPVPVPPTPVPVPPVAPAPLEELLVLVVGRVSRLPVKK